MEIAVNNVSVCTIHLDDLNKLTEEIILKVIHYSLDNFINSGNTNEIIIKISKIENE